MNLLLPHRGVHHGCHFQSKPQLRALEQRQVNILGSSLAFCDKRQDLTLCFFKGRVGVGMGLNGSEQAQSTTHPHPDLPPEGEGVKPSRFQAAHDFIGPFEGLTQ